MATKKVVDFSNVKDAGEFQPKRVPAGDYLAKIVEVKDGESKKSGDFQWVFKITLQGKSGSYPYYCKLAENQLWKLRNLFIAAGLNVPKKRVNVDPNRVVGKMIGVTMEDDEYQDKLKSVIGATFPAADIQDSTVPAEDDDYEDEDEEEEEPAEEEVEEEDEEEEPAPPPARRRARKPAPEPEPEEEEEEADDEEEEEEPEPTPPPRRRAKKAAPARRRAAATVTDEELEELDIDGV